MGAEPLDETIKTRVEAWMKEAFRQIAYNRHLDVADIVREALREYLEKQRENRNPDQQTTIKEG